MLDRSQASCRIAEVRTQLVGLDDAGAVGIGMGAPLGRQRAQVVGLAHPAVVGREVVVVHAQHAVVGVELVAAGLVQRLLVDEDGADVGPREHAPLHGRHGVVVCRQAVGGVGGRLDVEQAHAPLLGQLAAQARAEPDGVLDILPRSRVDADADAAREEGIDALLAEAPEQVGILEEELPLFRKGDLEARQVGHLAVHLHLTEVGVDREVEVEAGAEADLHVAAGIEARARLAAVFEEVLRHVGRDVGDEREVAAGLAQRLFELEHAHVGHVEHPLVAGDALPGREFVVLRVDAVAVEAPVLLAFLVAQRAEGDSELGRPVIVVHLRVALPAVVPRRVEVVAVAAPVGDERLAPHAIGVEAEVEGVGAVVEGVEQ